MKPTGLPRLNEIGIDGPVLLFTFGLALFVSLVIGSIPAIKYAGAALHNGLREGGRALSQSRERHRARKALVVVQVALALVLLICSGLMIHTFRALMHVSPGFADPDTVQTFHLYIPESRVPDTQRERVVRMQQEIADKIAAIPGVSSVSFGTNIPFQGYGSNDPIFVKDRIYKPGELPPIRRFKFISPGFFATLGTPLLAGPRSHLGGYLPEEACRDSLGEPGERVLARPEPPRLGSRSAWALPTTGVKSWAW